MANSLGIAFIARRALLLLTDNEGRQTLHHQTLPVPGGTERGKSPACPSSALIPTQSLDPRSVSLNSAENPTGYFYRGTGLR